MLVPSHVKNGLSLSTPHFMYPVRIVEITIKIKSVIPILLVLRIIRSMALNGSITNTLPDSVINQMLRSIVVFPEELCTYPMNFFSNSNVFSESAITVQIKNAVSNKKNDLERIPNNMFCN